MTTELRCPHCQCPHLLVSYKNGDGVTRIRMEPWEDTSDLPPAPCMRDRVFDTATDGWRWVSEVFTEEQQEDLYERAWWEESEAYWGSREADARLGV